MKAPSPIRVLVVDDSAFMRRVLTRILESDPALQVVGTARDGLEAVARAALLKPDVITLDVEMPRLDGLSALPQILAAHPCPVVMVSSLTQQGAQATVRALALGAVDFVAKPSGAVSLDLDRVAAELVAKVKAAAAVPPERLVAAAGGGKGSPTLGGGPAGPAAGRAAGTPLRHREGPLPGTAGPAGEGAGRPGQGPFPSRKDDGRTVAPGPSRDGMAMDRRSPAPGHPPGKPAGPAPLAGDRTPGAPLGNPPAGRPSMSPGQPVGKPPAGRRLSHLVLIASSTGGPGALYRLLGALPAGLPAAVVIVQHMPPGFTRALAEHLDATSGLTVAEAWEGAPLCDGWAWVAPGDYHLLITAAGTLRLDQGPPVHGVRPAADITFASVPEELARRALVLVLTGMGADGARGAQQLHRRGARVWVQDAASCVVPGMPGATAALGVAERSGTPEELAAWLVEALAAGGEPAP
ncbi:chemotaxis response regulator protein-glutamate methylesterase [Thermaerobacter sp. PB12/4term]|uniref:protein-glutamate methylesterase/protein-glutamine glutaminase n=1 Tax=Thermaerobacter sp. PB12/4term TaxID=2293838 RepID=UPI000E32B050|nr:chemotaxis response regulator protein-glutamate methylesterase [Thermaerobacter sp. PB12/4term]QIA27874.1 chemotaxis response regulator protein-glutamate methylesterase [Thermaerobacter sp. PB12/4term]